MSLQPVRFDKEGPMYLKSDVQKYVINETLLNNGYLRRLSMNNAKHITEVAEIMDDSFEIFDAAYDRMRTKCDSISDQSKKTSGAVRDAANKLADGLVKVEKAADFTKLERYADLLERCAAAMTVLAELEQSGKLNKIAQSLK